jgi:cytochrome c biogenesis protein CcmG, thiol:disulfide interchange protein DsbE
MSGRPRPRFGTPAIVASSVLALAAAVGTYAWLADGDGGGGGSGEVVRLGADQGDPGSAPPDPGKGGDLAGLSYQELGGTTTDLADLLGRPLVINFFGSWCVPCIREMPVIERVAADLGDEVTFLGLAVRDRPEDARRIVADTGVTYRVGRDVDDRVYTTVGAAMMPTTAFVSPDGEVVRVRLGELDEDELRSLIADHLGVGS